MVPLWSEESGHARVELLVSHTEVQPGQSIPAALRMVYEKDWHGYWINPGESGIPTEVEWELPAGWTASPLQFPLPHRIVAGGLVSYGYEGEIWIPFTLTAPAEIKDAPTILGTVNWLACNDKRCVSGEATVEVTLQVGKAQPSPHAAAITAALNAMPAVDEKLRLQVTSGASGIELKLSGAAQDVWDGAEIFPITEQALDPREPILLKKAADGYVAHAKKNEYASGELTQLTLVIVPKAPQRAVRVEWKK